MTALDRTYWEQRYHTDETGWDIGGPSTPLKEYIDQLTDKDLRILIPGGGRAWEAEYAHRNGFRNVFVIDLTDAPFKDLLTRCPDFPEDHLITDDFFTHEGRYDRIMEQTFFCALHPSLRERYVAHTKDLLKPGGKLVGVLFNDALNTDHPPFGGSKADYAPLFRRHFTDLSMEPCRNSIAPRAERELWLCAVKAPAYTAIDRDLCDQFEAAAASKKRVLLELVDGGLAEGRIVDLFHRDQAGWLRMDQGDEIRLDRIVRLVNA